MAERNLVIDAEVFTRAIGLFAARRLSRAPLAVETLAGDIVQRLADAANDRLRYQQDFVSDASLEAFCNALVHPEPAADLARDGRRHLHLPRSSSRKRDGALSSFHHGDRDRVGQSHWARSPRKCTCRLGRCENWVKLAHDATRHAEIVAIGRVRQSAARMVRCLSPRPAMSTRGTDASNICHVIAKGYSNRLMQCRS